MNRIVPLTILLGSCILNGAWTTNIPFSNKMSGSGNENEPLKEKDYAYLFCASDEDARESQSGKADWRRSNSDEYCHYSHRDRDDTWKSGWERSRLIRGCKTQLNMFGVKVFQCYNFRNDPQLALIEQQLNEKKKQDYEEWLVLYNAKVLDLQNSANQTFDDVDAELKIAQDARARAAAEHEKLVREAEAAKKAIADLSTRYSSLDGMLSSIMVVFDRGFKTMTDKIEVLSATIVNASSELSNLRASIKAGDQTYASLSTIQTNGSPILSKYLAEICKPNDIPKILENLRSQVAYINKLVDPLIVDAQNLELPLLFASDQSTLVTKVSSLHSISEKRSFIFSSVYDLIGESPSICDQINGFNTDLFKAVALAQRVEQLKRTTGIILNMDDAIKQADIQKEADAQYQAVLVSAKDIPHIPAKI